MAFTRATGKHCRPSRFVRSSAYAAGIALTATGVIGGLAASPAPAAPWLPEDGGLTQALLAGTATADRIGAQAAAQRQAADEDAARRTAERNAERAAQEAKRKAEARAEAARSRKATLRAARVVARRIASYTAPISSSYVTTGYRTGGSLWSSGSHTGIDFHAETGTPVHAVAAGTVVEAGWGGAYGNNIVIRMDDGTYTQYGHLSTIGATVGQRVTSGQRIALSGATGNATGPHLHFEARTTPEYGSDIDPVAYLRSHGVAV